MPGQAVPDKICFVGLHNMWCLVVDGIVASEYWVVDHTHVACTAGEQVVLEKTFSLVVVRVLLWPTFLVKNIGVGIKWRGPSAHGLRIAVVVILEARYEMMDLWKYTGAF